MCGCFFLLWGEEGGYGEQLSGLLWLPVTPYLHIVSKHNNMCLTKVIIYHYWLPDTELVLVIARFVVIVGISTISDISKLLHTISRAIRRVKFGTILKRHKWYLQYAKHHVQIIL